MINKELPTHCVESRGYRVVRTLPSYSYRLQTHTLKYTKRQRRLLEGGNTDWGCLRTECWGKHPPIQWVPGALSLGVKRSGREADHSPPSSAEVKNAWSYTSTPHYASLAWCSVKSTRTTLPSTFTLITLGKLSEKLLTFGYLGRIL